MTRTKSQEIKSQEKRNKSKNNQNKEIQLSRSTTDAPVFVLALDSWILTLNANQEKNENTNFLRPYVNH